jgi:transglutaminase-like putative cysteine protease
MAAPQAPDGEALRSLAWACAAFAGGVLLNLDRVPPWTAATALLLIAWRLTTERSGVRLPGTVARALLALGVVAVVLWRFHTLNGLAAGTALLMLMSALKLLETRARRDQFVMVGAGLFLLLAACLDRQSLVRVPLYALQVWLCCSALAVVASAGCGGRAALRLAGRSLLLALPLAVLLFLFFPRLPGAFWAIPRGGQGLTGLSDTMNPGSIVKLVASYEPAFRVQFAGRAPPAEELYWRGPVLHDFDGHTWRRESGAFHLRQRLQYLGTPYRYRVALEPTRQRWWFALDTPAQTSDANVLLTYDNQLLGAEPLTEPLSFDALSYTRTRALEPLGARGRQQDTTLPPGANPRSVALAQTLRQRGGSDADFVQATLEYLRSGGFVYTLTPDALGADPVDDFLFDTRAGFCGHYASAFVTLMRAAQVPARVVTGYLGGEWNPIGDYFLVRQSDAHAWAEVWLEGRGWTRIDPTAVVAPERLRRGVFDLLPDALATRERLLRSSAWLTRALQRWDAANAWWSDHVVKFDYSAQLDLLGRFGIRSPDVRYLGWAFMLALLGWLAIIAWHIGRSARPASPDALARAYARLCRKLARTGAPRAPYQGPLSLAETLRARRPDLSDRVQPLLTCYAQLRYEPAVPHTRNADIEQFRRAVARLSLPRAVRN